MCWVHISDKYCDPVNVVLILNALFIPAREGSTIYGTLNQAGNTADNPAFQVSSHDFCIRYVPTLCSAKFFLSTAVQQHKMLGISSSIHYW